MVGAIRADEKPAIEKLRQWIALPTIANMGMNHAEGADYMRRLALDAGFTEAKIIPTKGVPSVFATLDAGAPVTLGIYFMYDVKHYDPAEWTSPPLEARLVDRPGEGKAIVGRGAVNQKGPEMAFLTAVKAFKTAGRQAARQPRAGRRGRGGNRLAQLPAGLGESRGQSRAEQGGGHLHPLGEPEQHRRGPAQPRRQGRDRGPADLERREMGARARTRTSIRA